MLIQSLVSDLTRYVDYNNPESIEHLPGFRCGVEFCQQLFATDAERGIVRAGVDAIDFGVWIVGDSRNATT